MAAPIPVRTVSQDLVPPCGGISLKRVGALLLRRIRYAGRFIFWTVKHRSTANVRWVLAFEGFTWNDEQQVLDEGVDYFAVEGAKARARIEVERGAR